MNKNTLFLSAFLAIASFSVAQDKTAENKKAAQENIYSPLKPADGTPAVFSSKEEMDAKLPAKKNNLLNLIKENSSDTAQVRMLREQLWRFENAVVRTPK